MIKTISNHNIEQQVYSEIIKIGHEVEESSLNVLIEVANIDKQRFYEKSNSPEADRESELYNEV